MQLAAHEAHDLNELILSCVNTITNMSFFLNQVRDPELRDIRNASSPVRDYNPTIPTEPAKPVLILRDKTEYLKDTKINLCQSG